MKYLYKHDYLKLPYITKNLKLSRNSFNFNLFNYVFEMSFEPLQHDGLTKAQGWFVEQVEVLKKVKRSGQERIWLFVCRQWLSLHESDCQISRELFAKHYSKTGVLTAGVT